MKTLEVIVSTLIGEMSKSKMDAIIHAIDNDVKTPLESSVNNGTLKIDVDVNVEGLKVTVHLSNDFIADNTEIINRINTLVTKTLETVYIEVINNVEVIYTTIYNGKDFNWKEHNTFLSDKDFVLYPGYKMAIKKDNYIGNLFVEPNFNTADVSDIKDSFVQVMLKENVTSLSLNDFKERLNNIALVAEQIVKTSQNELADNND